MIAFVILCCIRKKKKERNVPYNDGQEIVAQEQGPDPRQAVKEQLGGNQEEAPRPNVAPAVFEANLVAVNEPVGNAPEEAPGPPLPLDAVGMDEPAVLQLIEQEAAAVALPGQGGVVNGSAVPSVQGLSRFTLPVSGHTDAASMCVAAEEETCPENQPPVQPVQVHVN